MCGRYGLIPGKNFYDRFEIANRDLAVPVNYNIAPGLVAPVITIKSPKKIEMMKWGMGYYHSFNARSEEIEIKPSFRNAFKNGRCLVPASGFYEWHEKIPYWISLKEEEYFGMAGIYENNTFSIVTTAANEMMKPIHDRMPVILDRSQEEVWLDNGKFELEILKGLTATHEIEGLQIENSGGRKRT